MAAILVVDDDASPRSLAQIILEDRGYRVLVADGGRQALQIARAPAPTASAPSRRPGLLKSSGECQP